MENVGERARPVYGHRHNKCRTQTIRWSHTYYLLFIYLSYTSAINELENIWCQDLSAIRKTFYRASTILNDSVNTVPGRTPLSHRVILGLWMEKTKNLFHQKNFESQLKHFTFTSSVIWWLFCKRSLTQAKMFPIKKKTLFFCSFVA